MVITIGFHLSQSSLLLGCISIKLYNDTLRVAWSEKTHGVKRKIILLISKHFILGQNINFLIYKYTDRNKWWRVKVTFLIYSYNFYVIYFTLIIKHQSVLEFIINLHLKIE